MKPLPYQSTCFTRLLSKFVTVVYLSESEQELMHDFIFSTSSTNTEFQENSELYETLEYLRDLAQESNYTTIEELAAYFDQQQKELTDLVMPLLSENEDRLQGLSLMKVYEIAFKTEAIRLLTGVFIATPAIKMDKVVNYLHLAVTQPATPSDTQHVFRHLNLMQLCLHRLKPCADHRQAKSILPNSNHQDVKYYFEKFATKDKTISRWIYAWKLLKESLTYFSLRTLLRLKKSLSHQRKQKAKVSSMYEQIFSFVQLEKSIDDQEMKMLLSRMMLMTKFNNPSFLERHTHLSHASLQRFYYRHLSSMKWFLLKSPSGHSWVTSDNPGFSIDITPHLIQSRSVAPDPYWTNLDSHNMIYFPLSADYCLRLEGLAEETDKPGNASKETGITFSHSTEKEIEVVNKLVFSSNPRVVISEEEGFQLQCS